MLPTLTELEAEAVAETAETVEDGEVPAVPDTTPEPEAEVEETAVTEASEEDETE
jgi:hypothetical protein